MLPTINFMTKSLVKKSNARISFANISLFSLIVSVFLFSSCTKEPGKIGLVIQPEESKLKVGFSDTSTILSIAITIPDRIFPRAYRTTKVKIMFAVFTPAAANNVHQKIY